MSSARAIALAGLWAIPGIPTCFNVYRSDVERMCDAEHRSGKTVKADAAGVMGWMQGSIASAKGVILRDQLAGESFRDRASHLRSEAQAQSLQGCALADAFDAAATDDDYKTAVQSLCDGKAVSPTGDVAMLDVAPADDTERIREVRDWTLANLKGQDALKLVDKLAQTPVQGRPAVLRAEAGRLGIATCGLAATLEHPPPAPLPVTLVSLPSFTVGHIDGSQKVQEAITGQMNSYAIAQGIDQCYGVALVKAPALSGTVSMRMTFDAKGKVTRAEESSSTLGNPSVVKCLTTTLTGAQLIQGEKSVVHYTATLTLTPVRGSPTPGWPTTMPTSLNGGAPGGGGGSADAGTADTGRPDAGKKKKGK